MSKKLNLLSITRDAYSSFLSKRSDEFAMIADSGYGLYWFAQCFYVHWHEVKKAEGLELYGNMGHHYSSQRVSQFSEVIVSSIDEDHNHIEYKSNIFIFTLLGLERTIKKELAAIKKHIYEDPKQVLPFNIFLIRFDSSQELGKSVNSPALDLLFNGIEWIPSFDVMLSGRTRRVSVGCI